MKRSICRQMSLAGLFVVAASTQTACSDTKETCEQENRLNTNKTDDVWDFFANLKMAPPPSLVKCVGAMVAGSVFALMAMFMEARGGEQRRMSREELGNLIPKRPTKSAAATAAAAPQKPLAPASEPTVASDPAATAAASVPPESSEGGDCAATTADVEGDASGNAHPAGNNAINGTSSSKPEKLQRESQAERPLSLSLRFGKQREMTEVERTIRQVKSILNKLTRERFDTLYAQLLGCFQGSEAQGEIIQAIAREVFAKATLEHTFVEMYADVCAKLHADLQTSETEVNFKRALLDQCQESFNHYLEPPQIDETLDYEERYEALVKYKTRMLGNVRLIGHLLRQRMLSTKIIFHCTEELFSIGSVEALETLTAFLETLAPTFDTREWSGKARLKEVFARVELLYHDKDKPARIRCLLKDLLEKRERGWRDWPMGSDRDRHESGGGTSTPSRGARENVSGRAGGFSGTATAEGGQARVLRRNGGTPVAGGGSGHRTPLSSTTRPFSSGVGK